MATNIPLVLAYAGCGTCKKAIAWFRSNGIEIDVRPIVESPPTRSELASWIPRSARPVRKWLNTSGQSYRALDKSKLLAASDDEIAQWLANDGKLVKRPVVVSGDHVLVGFDEEAYRTAFAASRTRG